MKVLAGASTVIIVGAMFMLGVSIIGAAIEATGERLESRERCLRAATNGYEIERCR